MQDAQPIQGRTVLVVDDEEMLVELVRRMVQRHGFATLTATSAEDALKLFEEHNAKVDLVITDLMMPGMDGRALARELLRRDASLRILVSTGYSATGDLSDVEAMGIRGVVMKPYQSEQLMEMVNRALAD